MGNTEGKCIHFSKLLVKCAQVFLGLLIIFRISNGPVSCRVKLGPQVSCKRLIKGFSQAQIRDLSTLVYSSVYKYKTYFGQK